MERKTNCFVSYTKSQIPNTNDLNKIGKRFYNNEQLRSQRKGLFWPSNQLLRWAKLN